MAPRRQPLPRSKGCIIHRQSFNCLLLLPPMVWHRHISSIQLSALDMGLECQAEVRCLLIRRTSRDAQAPRRCWRLGHLLPRHGPLYQHSSAPSLLTSDQTQARNSWGLRYTKFLFKFHRRDDSWPRIILPRPCASNSLPATLTSRYHWSACRLSKFIHLPLDHPTMRVHPSHLGSRSWSAQTSRNQHHPSNGRDSSCFFYRIPRWSRLVASQEICPLASTYMGVTYAYLAWKTGHGCWMG